MHPNPISTVLVTGAQGWIGRAAVDGWLEHPGTSVWGVGRSPERPELRRPGYQYVSLDLADAGALRALLTEVQPDAIVHLAGLGHHGAPTDLMRANVAASAALVAAVRDACPRRPRVVLGSSGALYGEPVALPQDERHPTRPETAYAASKLSGELTALPIAEAAGIPLIRARIFNVVGPGQPDTFLPGVLARRLAAITAGLCAPELCLAPLHTTRDYLDVRDVAAALAALAERGEPGTVVNVGSGVETRTETVWEILYRLARAHGAPAVTRRWRQDPPGNLTRQVAAVDRLRAVGFRPLRSLEQSLAELFEEVLGTLRVAHVQA